MAYVTIWIHAVWGTKNNERCLTKDVRTEVIKHIRYNAKQKGIHLSRLNGHEEHLHTLISLNPDQSMSKVMQLLKGESAHWINKEKIIKGKFEWKDEYYAVSVSPSVLGNVRNYIDHQETHHQRKSYIEEYEEFLKVYRAGIFDDMNEN